ncbi:hypothetical protein ACJ73_05375 [Blastomyces percursus]|uniref:Uncharacterized protein n=1 Tax=Blastomyces percursus TaxID=1658174 RepID=A0A1J9R6K7_9EURO|nr:hypothetical protein ACJ73_05375 [Blastomyces percursus]
MPPGKPLISRAELERDGMVYFDGVFSEDADEDLSVSLPAHVESYRQALLDFSVLGPDCSQSFTPGSFVAPDTQHNFAAFLPMTKDELRRMDHCADLSKRARDLDTAYASDHEWQNFLGDIFKEYKSVFPSSRGQRALFDQFSLEKNILWDDTKQYAKKCPKPNFTYGYPIVRDIPIALRSAEPVTNFSLEVLGDLRSAGLISSPVRSLHEWTKDKLNFLSPEELVCFPWAVVEQSRGIFSTSENCARVANAALTALRLNQELSKWATCSDDSVPPVVAFTCIAPDIKVWLTYLDIKDNFCSGYKMVCIWKHSLCQDRGVLETCTIVENMLLWSSRVWKPKISGYISRIRQSKPALFSPGHVPKPTILSLRKSLFEPSAKSTQAKPTSPIFVFVAQRPSSLKAGTPDSASYTSMFTPSEQHLSITKGNDQDPGAGKSPPTKLIANTAEGSTKDERRRRKPVSRLPKVKYDETRGSGQKDENDTQRSARADPATVTIPTTEAHTKHNIVGNVHRSGLESAEALEKLSERINSLDLDKSVQTAVGIQSTGKDISSQANDVTIGGTDKESQENPAEGLQATTLETPSRTTSAIDNSDTALSSDSQSKHGDENIGKDLHPLTERSEHHRSHQLHSVLSNDDNSLSAGSPKIDVPRGREDLPKHSEGFRDSPDEPEPIIGTCPHFGAMVAESLQLLCGDELLRLKAVSEIILELQGLELLDVTWSVLELWVAQHANVPSPCGALDNIIRELNGALGSPDTIITPEQMWASEPGTWENIDKALQSILKSREAALRNILKLAIECMDLLESLELCNILKLGELSCSELKRMDQEIIDNILASVAP